MEAIGIQAEAGSPTSRVISSRQDEAGLCGPCACNTSVILAPNTNRLLIQDDLAWGAGAESLRSIVEGTPCSDVLNSGEVHLASLPGHARRIHWFDLWNRTARPLSPLSEAHFPLCRNMMTRLKATFPFRPHCYVAH